MRPAAPETVALPAPETTAERRIPLRDITNTVEATRPSLLPAAATERSETQNATAAAEGQNAAAAAEETEPGKKPLASDRSTGTEETEACPLTDPAVAAAAAEISVPSLPPVRAVRPSTEQPLQDATGAAHVAGGGAASSRRKRRPPKKATATPPSDPKKARRRRALRLMR